MSGLSRLSHGSGMIVSGRTARPEVSVVPEGRNARGVSSLTRNRGQTNADTPNELRIEVIPISSLKPYERNARIHSANQIRDIAESMKKFGVTMPILIDRNRVVVAGHARLEALKLLGRERVHVISLENLTEKQVRAYRLADNKLSANSTLIAIFRFRVSKPVRLIFWSRILTKAAQMKAMRFRRSMKPHQL